MNIRSTSLAGSLLLTLCAGGTALAAGFPPITAAEWAVESVPGEPGVHGVVLHKKAKLRLRDLARQEVSSSLVVEVREKVLGDPSEVEAEVSLPHSRYMRLYSFSGRTVLPGGREIPLPKDAKFERRLSRNDKVFVTSVAFPAVEKGAILDYRYEMRFDSIVLLTPFYLSELLPVRYAEVEVEVPSSLQARTWSIDPFQVGLQSESTKTSHGTRVRIWAEDLPAIPEEPFSPPFATLATQVLLLPTAYSDGYEHTPLMESWATTCRLFDDWHYDTALRKDGGAKKEAKRLTARGSTPRAKAMAIFEFVRDEIVTEDVAGIGLENRSTAGGTLEGGRGDWAEKALLLHAMLDAVGIPTDLVWAGDRNLGMIDPGTPNPGWFDRILVTAGLDGETVFLDPSVPGLPFGRLLPGVEGTPALVFDRKKPRPIELPASPGEGNRRSVEVQLTIGEDGGLSGRGVVALSGHHVWSETPDGATLETIREAWEARLVDSFQDFRIDDVIAEGVPEDDLVRVLWNLRQSEEEILGDEARLAPQRPLGPARQLFAPGETLRRTPVLFRFADRDSLELTLEWPDGWVVEAVPSDVDLDLAPGRFRAVAEVDLEARRLVYARDFDLQTTVIGSQQAYEEIRSVFEAARKHDAQAILLVRR